MKKIVIIGAGYGGIITAKKLAKKLTKFKNASITIIDKNPFHTMLTELHEVAAGRVDEDSIKIELSKVFAGRKVDVVMDTVKDIDFEGRKVIGEDSSYDYDYLVMAAGSKPTYFGIKGAEEYSYKLWSYDDAVILKDHIHNVFRKASRITKAEDKKKLLTFYVVGAGFTGVEMIGELAEYVPILCEKYDIKRDIVSLNNVDVLPRPVSILPEKLSRKVEKRLNKMQVNVMMNTGVVGIGKDYIELNINNEVKKYDAGTVIWTAGIESSDITNEAAKDLQSAGRGRIKTDKYLRSPDRDNVYIVGDNLMYKAPGEKEPVPQMVENCEQSAEIAAHNIICAVTGKGEMKEYKPQFHGIMVSVGGRYGVARVGLPNRMINLPSFLAMFTKHFINIIYFIQVLGWNKLFSYIKHEFFTIRNARSFVGGHFSNRTPSFLLVPLRIWLGAIWLFEGITKIVQGWLSAPKLSGFFGAANAWFNAILWGTADSTTSATGAAVAADAVSKATGAEAGTTALSQGVTILNLKILNLFDIIFVSGKKLVDATQTDYAFKLDIPFVDWIVNKFVLSSDSMQLFMQGFIVVAEILIGLALIGGLFTTPASAFSLVLQFMFITTTGLYLSTFWMIFAAIAVLIGAGRTFGFDYYVMPFLKRKWKRLPFVRKWYIYND